MNASAQHQLAQQHLMQGQIAEAIAIVNQLLALEPDDAIGNYLQAQILIAQGQLTAAQAHLEKAIAQAPAYVEALLKLGNVQFMQQNFAAAIAAYQKVSAINPHQVEAFYYAGLAYRQSGKNDEAIASYQSALNLASDRADIWTAMGNVYFAKPNYDQAAHCYRQAIAADPTHANAYNGLGGVLGQQGNAAAATENFRQAIGHDPRHLDALTNLGMALFRQEQYDQALIYLNRAAKLNPKQANLQRNIGLVLYKQEQLAAAIAQYQKAIDLDPRFADAYASLGVALVATDQPAAAIAAYQRAIEIIPNHAEANYNLGVILAQQNQLAEAVLAYCRAIAARPTYADAYNGLGATLLQQGNLDGALNSYQQALAIAPDHYGANFGRGLTLLTKGDFAAGLPGYEYRFKLKTIAAPEFSQPLWDGSEKQDQTMLLWIEQGLGDAIQFIRFVPIVAQRVGHVILRCRNNLVPLFANVPELTSIATIIGDRDPLPNFDVHASLLSLPQILGIRLESIPSQVPYLKADRQRVEQLQLPAAPGLKIGIVWASGLFKHNPNAAKQYKLKSLSLLLWTGLLTIPGTRFYSLQLGQDQQEISWLALKNHLVDLSDRITDFADTAALIAQLDLVISVDTAVAHLAGAMGKPTWVLLPFAPDWRWLTTREDSPWYPTMRLFRQSEPHQWRSVMDRVRDELIELVKTSDLAQQQPLAKQLAKFTPGTTPDHNELADYWQKLAAKLAAQAKHEEARFYYRRVLDLQPNNAEVANNLGYIYWRSQKLADADIYLDRALALNPNYAEAFNNKGIVAWTKQNYDAAIEYYQQALAIEPDYAMAHSNLGVVLSHQKEFIQAEEHYRRAIEIKPDYTQAFNNLGISLYEQDRSAEAIPYYRQALALNPDYYQALSNCGAALVAEGQIDEAIALYHRAIAINADYPEVQNNLGMALLELGQVEAGLNYFHRAIALRPDYVDARTNLAMAMLTLGEYESGFAEYEWRRDGKSFHRRNFAQPLWDGKPFPGKTLLIRTEQGLGDTIQFIRYMELVKQLGDRIVVECNHKALQPLLETIPAIDQVLAKGAPLPKFDLHISLLSLPHLLKTNLNNIPDRFPYLQINQPFNLNLASSNQTAVALEQTASQQIDSTDSNKQANQAPANQANPITSTQSPESQSDLKVGIVWRSDSKNKTKQKRSCPLAIFQQVLQIPQVQFYSLQKEIQDEDLELIETLNNKLNESGESGDRPNSIASTNSITLLSEQLNSLTDTAAAIAQLDLVISIDTMVAHLAGALAKPVWVLLPLASDWRWLLDRPDSVWYPTARLFRQPKLADWQPVIKQVCEALNEIVADRSLLASPLPEPTIQTSKLDAPSNPEYGYVIDPDRLDYIDQTKATEQSTSKANVERVDNRKPAIANLATKPTLTVLAPTAITANQSQSTVNTIQQSTPTPPVPQPIGIGWAIGANTGWGTFGLNLTLQLLEHKQFSPLLIAPPAIEPNQTDPLTQARLIPAIAQRQGLQQAFNQNPHSAFNLDLPIIHPLGNHFGGSQLDRIKGKQNIGFIFFEDTQLDRAALDRANAYDLILAGSSWNHDILKNYGLANVHTVLQGIEPTAYYPSPKSNLFGDRFVIFSGGKLEYRKAQDITIAAYKIFQAKHPDALLITAWHNPWPKFMQGLEQTGNVVGLPAVDNQGQIQIKPWLIENGLPIDSFIDLGAIPRHQVPQIIREADVALFPNRCEGGTNLVAMECMACGIPCVISANTGHLDIVNEKHCYPLTNQRSLTSPPAYLQGVEGWRESEVEEVVAYLEQVYSDRQTALNKGAAAAEFMQGLTWQKQVDRLTKTIQAELLS